ncbi:MAG: serine/threonine-protein kinase [Gammaproteobacteria bacterium]|nr:serine/threonine-protein kinase [Gammaproteobacteria bacterium]
MLGEGGMGSVYRALDLLKQEAGDDDPYVALKVMHPEIASAELTFMALQREARRAQDLAHPNIVTVFDLDRVDGIVYMTMELLSGEDSEQRVKNHPDGLDPKEARSIVEGVSEGLAYAHTRGITHADLKPQNVFIADDGRAKLLDFGIARAHQATKPDAIEEIFSGYTPAYASPEILSGEKAMPTDDVYALGCIAYFYFTGRHPFDSLPATEARDRGLKPERPRNMRRAEWRTVSKALNFNGAKRPRDASEFARRFSPSRVKQVAAAISSVAVVIALVVGLILGERTGPEFPSMNCLKPHKPKSIRTWKTRKSSSKAAISTPHFSSTTVCCPCIRAIVAPPLPCRRRSKTSWSGCSGVLTMARWPKPRPGRRCRFFWAMRPCPNRLAGK